MRCAIVIMNETKNFMRYKIVQLCIEKLGRGLALTLIDF